MAPWLYRWPRRLGRNSAITAGVNRRAQLWRISRRLRAPSLRWSGATPASRPRSSMQARPTSARGARGSPAPAARCGRRTPRRARRRSPREDDRAGGTTTRDESRRTRSRRGAQETSARAAQPRSDGARRRRSPELLFAELVDRRTRGPEVQPPLLDLDEQHDEPREEPILLGASRVEASDDLVVGELREVHAPLSTIDFFAFAGGAWTRVRTHLHFETRPRADCSSRALLARRRAHPRSIRSAERECASWTVNEKAILAVDSYGAAPTPESRRDAPLPPRRASRAVGAAAAPRHPICLGVAAAVPTALGARRSAGRHAPPRA